MDSAKLGYRNKQIFKFKALFYSLHVSASVTQKFMCIKSTCACANIFFYILEDVKS